MAQLAMAGLVAIIIFTVVLYIQQSMRKKQQSEDLADRIQTGGGFSLDDDSALKSLEVEPSDFAKSLRGILPLAGVGEQTIRNLRPLFERAGLDPADGPIIYLFCQRFLSVLFVLIAGGFLMTDAEGTQKMLHYMLGGFIGVIGLFGPKLYVENCIQKRQKELKLSFPDALDLLLICVESGLAMDAAINRVCEELGNTHPTITAELNRTRLELALLNDRTQALLNLGDRTDMVAFRSLATALIQTEKFGTSLADTLRVMSDDFRTMRILEAENRAARIPALMTVPLICFLLPAFMLIIIGPVIVTTLERGSMLGG
jgi:tight adherence protein C